MNHELLFKILDIASPTGREDSLKQFLTEHLSSAGVEPVDMGSAGLTWEIGEGERLGLVSVHIDQVGLVVERVDDEGYIYVYMPGIDPRVVPACEVTVWGSEPLKGVVGMVPPHYSTPEERKAPVPRKKLFVDTGMSAEKVGKIVSVGDACTWDYAPAKLAGNRTTGVGLDNRAGLYLSLLLTEALGESSLPGRLRFCANTQEEGVMFGAGYAGRKSVTENPCFALVVDATFGADQSHADQVFGLGKGPALGVGPILSRSHLAYMKTAAARLAIDYSLEPLVRATGTEVDVLSKIGSGIPAVLVSYPVRNMHTPVEVLDLEDISSTLNLLSTVLAEEGFWSC